MRCVSISVYDKFNLEGEKMSTVIVFQQMLVVLLMMMTGCYLFRRQILPKTSAAAISALIAKVCNPALMLSSAFDENNSATTEDILTAAVVAVVLYAILLILGKILPVLLKVSADERKFYTMMTVYGNIGFMGIPVASAVLGSESVIYLTVFILVFNVLVYTHGMQTLSRGQSEKGQWKRMINVGTIASVITVAVFLLKIPVHVVLTDTFTYMGRCTTFLSMVVLGGSLAKMSLKELFGEKRLYGFAAIRFFILPAAAALILRNLIANEMILSVSVLTLALPVANLPLMLAEEQQMEARLLAKGIILTTLLSVVSVTLSVCVLNLRW